MLSSDVLTKLKRLGKKKTAEIYRRHGATGEVWGVSFADLGALKKQIKTDHNIAQSLWKSGVLDAQTLALMIADPAALTPAEADEWLAQSQADVLLGYLAQLVARTSFARDKLRKNLLAVVQRPVSSAKFLDESGRFPYWQRRDTSPQREACYLEG
jgi:3-methyladenine DNA glycosylase AlkD